MKYFVEVETRRKDKIVLLRIEMQDEAEAKRYVGGIAHKLFGLKQFSCLNSFTALNDFGEPVLIQAKAYGVHAQVKEGRYTL